MAIGSVLNSSLKPAAALPDQNLSRKHSVRIFASPRTRPASLFCPSSAPKFSHCPFRIANSRSEIRAASSSVDPVREEGSGVAGSRKKKLGVVVKPLPKPRLLLKFIWMQKDIGIALNQMIPGYGTIPLSPYYFWPRKDAWEELKVLLESKPWISETQKVHLLNQATDIINLWQESGGTLS